MSQNRDEQKLKALFHDLRGEDEAHAPSFSHAWQAALARQGVQRRLPGGAPRWAIVATAAAVIICASLYFFFRSSSPPETPRAERSGPVAGATPVPGIPSVPGATASDLPGEVVSLPPKQVTGVRGTRATNASVSSHRRQASQAAVVLISQWRSPTDFLLAFPADRLLKSVPRLNYSIVDINPVLPEM
jgi:hypothetical protein